MHRSVALGVASLLTSTLAHADVSAISAIESSARGCVSARLRCEASAAMEPDVRALSRAVEPSAQQLRECLDALGHRDAPTRFRMTWTEGRKPVVELPLHSACTTETAARLEAMPSAEPLTLACELTCERAAEAPAPAPAPMPVPMPSPAPTPIPASVSVQPRDTWYGWQTLLIDAASLGTLAIGAAEWKLAPILAGYAGFAIGAPLIHGLHRNTHRAIGSFFLRLLGPVAAGALAYQVIGYTKPPPTSIDEANKPRSTDEMLHDALAALAVGTGVAFLTSVIVDSAVFGWERPTTRDAKLSPRFVPTLTLGRTSTIGVRASF